MTVAGSALIVASGGTGNDGSDGGRYVGVASAGTEAGRRSVAELFAAILLRCV